MSIYPNAILCNIEDFTKIKEFSVHYTLRKIVFTPDGKTALSLVPHTLTLWDVSLGKEIRTFTKSLSETLSTKFTPDGKTASIGGCKHLDIANACLIKKGYDKGYAVFKCSPDGETAISIYSTALVLWDISNGQEIKRFTGHTKQINYAAFSPDGKTIISVAEDNTIKIWDIESDKEISSFTVNSGKVLSVSPDGKTIISGSDKTIIIWDIESGKEIRTYTGHTAEVKSAFFYRMVSISFQDQSILVSKTNYGMLMFMVR